MGDHDLLDVLDAPLARARRLGAGCDRRRRRPARRRPWSPHRSPWSLVTAGGLFVSGAAFLVHEQNGWLFSRSAFLHHLIGWTLVVAALVPVGAALAPRRSIWRFGFAATWIVLAVMLFADRDVAPIFGHLSDFAGDPP